ncbi:MAG: hypothetical protein HY865_25190 [Chloroflexi bacterium]|nr:hypothetical protein [Chloroflexota bacterium]
MNKKPLKPKNKKSSKATHRRGGQSISVLKLHYKFWILIGTMFLAGIAIFFDVETPAVWTFLYGIGSWAALTANPQNLPR